MKKQEKTVLNYPLFDGEKIIENASVVTQNGTIMDVNKNISTDSDYLLMSGLMKTNFMPLTKASMMFVKTTMPHRFGDLEKSSSALAQLVVSNHLVETSGLYYDRSINTCPSSKLSYNEENAAQLWAASEDYVRE